MLWFIAVSGWVKLGSEPPVDVELDASEMSSFRRGGFSEVGTFLASSFPGFVEPGSAPSPVIELIKVREFGVFAEEFEEGVLQQRSPQRNSRQFRTLSGPVY